MKHYYFQMTIILILLLPKTGAAQLADSPWPMYQHDSRHTGKSQYAGTRDPVLEWSYKLGADYEHGQPEYAIGDIVTGKDGTIYVPVSNGTGMSATEGFLYAINPDGTLKWQYQFEGICVPAVTVPAIAADGTIYVHVNGNANVAAQERIYAINPDGTKKWEYLEQVAAFVTADLSSPVVANDGSITYTSMNTAGTRISSNGEHLADFINNYYNSIHSSPALISGDTLFISDAVMNAFKSSGELLWLAALTGDGSSGFNGSPSIDSDGTVYYANHNFVYAISPDGAVKWTYPIHSSAPIYSGYYSTVAVSSDGPIVSTATRLIALTREGTLKWEVPSSYDDPEDRFSYVSPTIGKDGIIYWQCWDSWGAYARLIIVEDGVIINEFDLPYDGLDSHYSPGSPRQSAVIMPDGTLLCISGIYLIALQDASSQCKITIVHPNGNEDIACNTQITWNSEDAGDNVTLQYYCNDVWNDITNSTPNDGSYNWTIPPNTICSSKIKIIDVANTGCWDMSDDYFNIDCSPCKLGDVNNDGSLTPGDALCAFQIYLNGGTPPPGTACDNECALFAADVNCMPNGITPGDALYIFQGYLSGKSLPLDCKPTALPKNNNNLMISITSMEGKPGEEIVFTIELDRMECIQAFGLDLGYAAELLTYVGIRATGITEKWDVLDGQINVDGVVTIGGFNAAIQENQNNKRLLDVVFKVKEEANGIGDLSLFNMTDDLAKADCRQGRFNTAIEGIRRLGGHDIPDTYRLEQNYPNPFNMDTEIMYQLPNAGFVTVTIYNSVGHQIRSLGNQHHEAGKYSARWDGKDDLGDNVPSGVYIYHIKTGKFSDSKKMILIK